MIVFTIMILKFTQLLMCGPTVTPCATVVHFVNFIIIGFLLRITNLLLVYRLQNLRIQLKQVSE